MFGRQQSMRLAFALALVAGVLALTAAAVGYARRGVVDPTPVGGGVLMLALAAGAWQASRGGSNAGPGATPGGRGTTDNFDV